MAAFTTATTIQAKELFQELQNAFYERYQVMCPAATPSWCLPANSIAAGVNLQDNAFWKAWYDRLSTLLSDAAANNSYFLQTTGTIPDYEDTAEGSISVYNGSADVGALWLAAVGSSSGPRRYTSANAWTYGRHVTGDAIGPWLITDMQLALKKLKYTLAVKNGSVLYQPPLQWDNSGTPDDRTYHLQTYAPWRIYWGRNHSGGTGGTSTDYDAARMNHDWTTGHYTNTYDHAGNISENALESSVITNRMGVMLRTYYGSALVARHVVASVTEAGFVQITGLPTSISHSADLYLVCDEVTMSEIEYATGSFLTAGKYWIDYGVPPPGDAPANVTWKPINYAGRVSAAGRFVKVQSFASSSSASHNYSFNPSLAFPAHASSEYNLFGYGGDVYDNQTSGGKDIPWHGCQMNKETYWVITWNWSYT